MGSGTYFVLEVCLLEPRAVGCGMERLTPKTGRRIRDANRVANREPSALLFNFDRLEISSFGTNPLAESPDNFSWVVPLAAATASFRAAVSFEASSTRRGA